MKTYQSVFGSRAKMCERLSRSSTRSGCQPTQCIPRPPSIGVSAGLEIASWACAWTRAGRRQSIQLHGVDRVLVHKGVDRWPRHPPGGLCSCFHLPSPTKTSRLNIRSSVCYAQSQSSFQKHWHGFFCFFFVFLVSQENTHSDVPGQQLRLIGLQLRRSPSQQPRSHTVSTYAKARSSLGGVHGLITRLPSHVSLASSWTTQRAVFRAAGIGPRRLQLTMVSDKCWTQ